MTNWDTEISIPTFAQEEYANSLIEHMREEGIVGSKSYARKVMQCQNRQEMSRLIDSMKRDLKQADSFIADNL